MARLGLVTFPTTLCHSHAAAIRTHAKQSRTKPSGLGLLSYHAAATSKMKSKPSFDPTSRDDGDLEKRVGMFQEPSGDGVPGLVVGHGPFLLCNHWNTKLLRLEVFVA